MITAKPYVVLQESVDPNGLHIIYEDPLQNEISGQSVLKRCGHWIGFRTAMRMFISQYEFCAYAHTLFGYGTITWEEAQEARTDAELASIVLQSYIHLMNYQGNCTELAIEEMKQSKRKWLPLFAHCLEQSNYTKLSLEAC